MPTKAEHHLEHAEHAQHHALDPFDRRVAMTIAMVAAALAFVTTLSHRGHTQTLLLQGESNQLQTEANILHTEATDKWSYYQAKNIREHQYETFLKLLPFMAKTPGSEATEKEAQKFWEEQVAKYKKELPEMRAEAEAIVAKARKLEAKAKDRLHEGHALHHRVDRYDYGEVGIELAMVLCSIAVLTKRKGFWLGGITFFCLGAIVVLSGYLEIGLEKSSHAEHGTTEHGSAPHKAADKSADHAAPKPAEKPGH